MIFSETSIERKFKYFMTFFCFFLIQCKHRNFDSLSSETNSKEETNRTLRNFTAPDVAILFPLVDRWDDFVRLLGLGWNGDGQINNSYGLISKSKFQKVLEEGYQSLNQQGDASAYSRNSQTLNLISNYERWKVMSVRYSPCTKPNPKALQIPCHPELRLIAQPLFEPREAFREGTIATPSDLIYGTKFGRALSEYALPVPTELQKYKNESFLVSEDQAIHLIYRLSAKDNSTILQALVSLKQSSESILLDDGTKVGDFWKEQDGRKDKVWVHPLFYASFKKLSGSDSTNRALREAEDAFKQALMHSARGESHPQKGAANLEQVLFLGTGVRSAGTGWAFSKFIVENNSENQNFRRAPLNLEPSSKLQDNFNADPKGLLQAKNAQILVHDYHGISISMQTPFQNQALSDDIIFLTNRFGVIEDQKPEFENRVEKITNPMEHGQGSRSCGNCHIATSSLLNSKRNQIDQLLKHPTYGKTYAGSGMYPMFFGFNLRQFGYYTSYPSISFRTQVEATSDALFVSNMDSTQLP